MKGKLHHMVGISRLRARMVKNVISIPSYSEQQLSESYFLVENYKQFSPFSSAEDLPDVIIKE